jgi:hypothetical protein
MDTVKRKLIEAFKRLVEFFRNMGTNYVVKNMKNQSEEYKKYIKSIFTKLHALCNKNITYLGSGKLAEEGVTKCKNDLNIVNYTRNKMMEVIKILNYVGKDAGINTERGRTIPDFKRTMDSLGRDFTRFFKEAESIANTIASYETVRDNEEDDMYRELYGRDPDDIVDLEKMKQSLDTKVEWIKESFDKYKSLIGTND